MATREPILSSSRAGLGSVVVARDSADFKTYWAADVGVMSSPPTVSGAAQMDGQTQVFVTSVDLGAGVVNMDGVASVTVVGLALATTGAARMDGQAQIAFASSNTAKGAAQMDGRASTVVMQSVLGAGLVEMDGAASMVAIAPKRFTVSVLENIVSSAVIEGKRNNEVVVSSVGMRQVLTPTWSKVSSLTQGLAISQTTSLKFTWGRVLTQAFRVSAVVGVGGLYKKSLAQLFKLVETEGLKLSHPVALSQGINLSLSLVGGISLKLLQKFLVATASSPVLTYHFALAGRVIVSDIADHFARAILTQLFAVHPAVGRQFIANNSLSQLLTVHPALNNKLILEITEAEDIRLSSDQLVHMLYKGDPLLDGVVITALYISPSGTITTWAVNTRTNAVTEYLNYDFRSFTRMGNRYIAAGEGGLYELDGDTDDGELIIGRMMSGYLQLNTKKLFGIKGAYIAIRGGGRFYLKLITGEGREYVYELRAQPNLMTTKVKVGKGLNTTYMAYELVTEGQDFDLDSIEFIPMTRGRRV